MTAKSKLSTLELVYIGMFVALLAICSYINIPTAVPFTMQTFGVFATLAILGQKRGAIAMFVFMLLGAIGVPVFAGFKSGIGVLIGPTGGYLFGYFLAIICSGFLIEHFGRKFPVMFFSMVLGLLICYVFGTAWFLVVYTKGGSSMGVLAALSTCVFPFVIPDLVKIVLAITLGNRLRPLLPSDMTN